MQPDPDRTEVSLSVDLLAPEGYGEIIGGGQRLDDFDLLSARIDEHDLPRETFEWYLGLRRYGSVPHGGFGMGLERVVAWICGLDHVREAIPYPRTLYRLTPWSTKTRGLARTAPVAGLVSNVIYFSYVDPEKVGVCPLFVFGAPQDAPLGEGGPRRSRIWGPGDFGAGSGQFRASDFWRDTPSRIDRMGIACFSRQARNWFWQQ